MAHKTDLNTSLIPKAVTASEMLLNVEYLKVATVQRSGHYKPFVDNNNVYIRVKDNQVLCRSAPHLNNRVTRTIENPELFLYTPVPRLPRPYDAYLTEDDEFLIDEHLKKCSTNSEKAEVTKAYLTYLNDFN